jgi:2-hydroxy-3-oxopropionate reductase
VTAVSDVGVIGLGLMGRPMAANLLRAGHAVTVFNRSRPAVDGLAALGAAPAGSVAEVAAAADVVITMLPDAPDVRAVLGELLPAARPGALVIDMSTIAPGAARELSEQAAAHGVAMLDAPVSGGDVGAQAGTLSIMVGGAPADVERARPLLEALGTTITHVGGPGAGQVVKACNQIVVALIFEAVSEALVLGSKAGVEPALILDVLSGGMAANRVMEVRRRNLLEHDFAPGFKTRHHAKDLAIVLDEARRLDVPLPATGLVAQHFAALQSRGRGDEDDSALLSLLEELARHRIGDPPPDPAAV